jgi:hypothetical protein
MTRSKLDREMDEAARAMTAEDRAVDYLGQNHRDHAAEIAMRTMYELALIWKTERDHRLIRDRNDPRLAFQISDQHVYRVHGMVAALPPPSQLDAVAKHYLTTLLAAFEPDRAWLTSIKIYNAFASPRYPFIRG